MLPFSTLISFDKKAAIPVYQQIANGLITIIRGGMIKPGAGIPSSREMAGMLQVHRKTIVAAYEELSAQDWITALPRKGITVSKDLPELKPRSFKNVANPAAYSALTHPFFLKLGDAVTAAAPKKIFRLVINDGFPDARIAPVDNLLRHYRLFFKKSYLEGYIMHGEAAGSVNLRNAIASFLADTRGIQTDSGNILVTRGAQMAIFIAARMILRPGSVVMVGEPSYSIANLIFAHFGAKLIKVPVDENGIDVDAIEKICKKKRPDMLYVIPHHHHPTTVTLSANRRMKLLDIIRTFKLPVIEDDYDYDFHYNKTPILPLASADHDGYVLYIGSITKSFASSVRIGYLVAGYEFIWQAARLREMVDLRGDVLMEEAMAVLFKNGDMQKHLKKAVKIYEERRNDFCSMLERELSNKVSFTRPAGGMSVWVKFDKKYTVAAVAKKVAAHGLFLGDGSFYNSGKTNYNAVRMGFASVNKKELEEIGAILKLIK